MIRLRRGVLFQSGKEFEAMIRETFVRNPHNYDVDEASMASGLVCEDPSLAKQSFAEEADINTIVRRFGLTGQLPVGVRAPTYGDFTGIDNYHEAANAIAAANEAFERMPAEVRARFENDPGKFVDFCSEPENAEEALKLGLVLPKAAALASDAVAVSGAPVGDSGATSKVSE